MLPSGFKEFVRVFEMLDTNGTGYITTLKLRRAYEILKVDIVGTKLLNIID